MTTNRQIWAFYVCAAATLTMIAFTLWLWGAKEVRGDPAEVVFLTFFGAVWLFFANRIFPWLGLSFRDDVVERRNVAAAVALCGGLAGAAFIYAGGSVGEGPSYYDNFFSTMVGAAGLIVLWVLLELGASVSRSIAEERDVASGVRLGAFLMSAGLVLGRAIAGNWHSEEGTIDDFFRDGWPAMVIWTVALGIERVARPGRHRPFPSWRIYGLFPALFYFALAIGWMWHLGRWEGMPQ